LNHLHLDGIAEDVLNGLFLAHLDGKERVFANFGLHIAELILGRDAKREFLYANIL
jgi:hypothetical protein